MAGKTLASSKLLERIELLEEKVEFSLKHGLLKGRYLSLTIIKSKSFEMEL